MVSTLCVQISVPSSSPIAGVGLATPMDCRLIPPGSNRLAAEGSFAMPLCVFFFFSSLPQSQTGFRVLEYRSSRTRFSDSVPSDRVAVARNGWGLTLWILPSPGLQNPTVYERRRRRTALPLDPSSPISGEDSAAGASSSRNIPSSEDRLWRCVRIVDSSCCAAGNNSLPTQSPSHTLPKSSTLKVMDISMSIHPTSC